MTLPPEIQRRTEADDVIWELPRRPWPQFRRLGWPLLLVGSIFAFVPLTVASVLGRSDELPPGVRLAIFAGALLFTLPELIFPALGCLLIWGRARIEWRRAGLMCHEVAGPLAWRRRIPREPPARIEVSRGRMRINGQPVAAGPLGEMAALMFRYAGGRKRLLAWGYPASWLEPLAEELRERFARTTDAPPVVVERNCSLNGTSDDETDVEEQPPGSTVRVEQRGDRLQLVIPPAGVRKGSKGLLVFSLIWCGFIAVFTAFLVFGRVPPGGERWIFYSLITVFWLVGLGMLATALNMGRRRALIIADAHTLRVAREGLLGKRVWRWRWEEIDAIRVGPSGMEINNVPVLELQIHPRQGRKIGLFSERDDPELRWLATLLRRRRSAAAE